MKSERETKRSVSRIILLFLTQYISLIVRWLGVNLLFFAFKIGSTGGSIFEVREVVILGSRK